MLRISGDLGFRIMSYLAMRASESDTLSYGAEIHRWLEEQAGREVRLTSVYRCLAELEAAGLATSRLGTGTVPKKFYSLTSAGRADYRAQANRLMNMVTDLQSIIDRGLEGLRGSDG